jgi:integrase/recombinase XerD
MALGEIDRDLVAIRLPAWGRVSQVAGPVPYLVVDDEGRPAEPIRRFLGDFAARGCPAGSVRSYAYDLHRWWRFLRAIGVEWDKVTSDVVRDFVLWMHQATKSRPAQRTRSAATAGQVNPITGKRHPGDRFQARTIRHSNAVLRCFYQFWIEQGQGPLVNPVPQERVRGGRANAHHNPLEAFRAEGRLRYNPKLPRPRPRAIPDERWLELFGALRSNRDRAILALAVSTGARAGELLGLTIADLDWGDQLIQVRRKGSGARQWLPASGEAFVWLRLWLEDLGGELPPAAPVWQTLRRRSRGDRELRRQPLGYDALRAVLRRTNEALGTNWTMHDMRHTCALRMVRSQTLSLRDVQTILGHAHLTTTQAYLIADDHEVHQRVRAYLARRDQQPSPVPAPGYDLGDLAVLLGGATGEH